MIKLVFEGKITAVQPWIKLIRSFDESYHFYLGYVLWLTGILDGREGEFSVGVDETLFCEHGFKVNDVASGECSPSRNPDIDLVQYEEVSNLSKISVGGQGRTSTPWEMTPPGLKVYEERGCRRLSGRTYQAKCLSCIWGCEMPVEMIIDPFDKRVMSSYRFETFCYGPLSCKFYKAGPKRRVPGRRGLVYIEEDWVDEDAVAHRDTNE